MNDRSQILVCWSSLPCGQRGEFRTKTGKEHLILKDDIEERKVSEISEISVMPTGMMQEFSTHEFSSLLDYLESLAK